MKASSEQEMKNSIVYHNSLQGEETSITEKKMQALERNMVSKCLRDAYLEASASQQRGKLL